LFPDCFSRCTGYNSWASYSPSTLGVLGAHKVAATRALVPDLAGSGNFDSFAQPLVGLLFWHLANSFKIIYLKQSK